MDKNEIITLVDRLKMEDEQGLQRLLEIFESCSQDTKQSPPVREQARLIVGEIVSLEGCRSERKEKIAGLIGSITRFSSAPDEAPETVAEAAAQEAEQPMIDTDILMEFLDEAQEHFQHIEANLMNLENDPDNAELINAVFRAFHSAKSTAGFVGLTAAAHMAHEAEMLIDRARNGEIKLTGEYADLALESADVLNSLMTSMRTYQGGALPPLPDNFNRTLSQLEHFGLKKTPDAPSEKAGEEKNAGPAVKPAPERNADNGHTDRKMDSTIRVSTQRLDKLIDMVGELVTTNSMISQDEYIQSEENPRLSGNVAQLNKIARELQDLGVSLRMVPLGPTFQKMERLARDLSRKMNKTINLVIEGEDTEIDRSMVETLNDPLVHLIRNAIDHGLESPEERIAKGKKPEGRLSLRAYHRGGNIMIELQDDGRGLDRDKILAKARAKGLLNDERMDDKRIFGMIFEPGFSTAEKVTDVSGRGVGLDVVKRNIESIRGRVDVSSQRDQGTCFALRIPLTLAIVDGLLLKVAEDEYLVPTLNVKMALRPEPSDVSLIVDRGEMLDFRGSHIPVFRLHELFQLTGAKEKATDALLLVVEHESDICALMADELLGQQQVVIKSLGNSFGNMEYAAGAAILGDGKTRLILDVAGIVSLARSRNYKHQASRLEMAAGTTVQ